MSAGPRGDTHAGPSFPWQTVLATIEEQPVTTDSVLPKLEEQGIDDPDEFLSRAVDRGEVTVDNGVVRVVDRGPSAEAGRSWHTNGAKSVLGDFTLARGTSGGESPSKKDRAIESVYDEFPDRVDRPLTERDGDSINEKYTTAEYREWQADERTWKCECGVTTTRSYREQHVKDEHAELVESTDMDRAIEICKVPEVPATGYERVPGSRKPVAVGEAVEILCESHAATRETEINLAKPRPGEPVSQRHTVEATDRWMPETQERYYAQLEAWLREICGGERPTGGESTANFDDPYIALVTLSASSVPNNERIGPVDHLTELTDAWERAYHVMRNTFRDKGMTLGEDWLFDRRFEPHTGDRDESGEGLNRGYAHEHVIVVTDGKVTAEDFRPMVERHVETCEYAGAEAHEVEDTVEVKPIDEIENLASYVADYASIEPDLDLFDRSPDYLVFAAAMAAGNCRTLSRSEAAISAAKADKCKQAYESGENPQAVDHGEKVRRSNRQGYKIECKRCGSPHGIDQGQTLTEATRSNPIDDTAPSTDNVMRKRWGPGVFETADGEVKQSDGVGGAVAFHSPIIEAKARERIQAAVESNPDMDTDAILGKLGAAIPPPEVSKRVIEAERGEREPTMQTMTQDKPPTWEVRSVTVKGDEYQVGKPSGVEMVDVEYPRKLIEEAIDVNSLFTCDRCGVTVGPASVVNHLEQHGLIEPTAEAIRKIHQNGDKSLYQKYDTEIEGSTPSAYSEALDNQAEAVEAWLIQELLEGMMAMFSRTVRAAKPMAIISPVNRISCPRSTSAIGPSAPP